MTFSQDGTRLLVVTGTGLVDVFDVDRCTGELSNWLALGREIQLSPDNWYGCSFSPDGTKIYVSSLDQPHHSRLVSWDLTSSNVAASRLILFEDTTNTYWGQHQVGPDGKIYITQISPDSISPANYALSVIHHPNWIGFAAQFDYLGLSLQGRRTSGNLPNLPNYDLGPLLAQTADAGPPSILICPGGSIALGVADTTGGAVTYAWSGPNLTNSSSQQPLARPDSTAWYYLTVTDTTYGVPCGVTTDSVLVVVGDSAMFPAAWAGNDTLVCPGDTIALGPAIGGGAFDYHWSASQSGNWIASPDSAQTLVAGAGTYSLTVSYSGGVGACFSASDVVKVTHYQSPMPIDPAGPASVICRGDTLRLGTAIPLGTTWAYAWSPSLGLDNAQSASPLATPTATTTYFLSAHDTLFSGTCAVMGDTVGIIVEQPFVHASPEDISFCVGECFTMGVPSVSSFQYLWSPISGLASPTASLTKAQPTATTIYTLSITNPALQSQNCREKQFTVLAIAGACNHQSFIAVNGDAIAERLDLGDHAGRVSLRVHDVAGRLVFSDDDYQNDWSATALAHGMYVYLVTVEGDCASSFLGKVVVVH